VAGVGLCDLAEGGGGNPVSLAGKVSGLIMPPELAGWGGGERAVKVGEKSGEVPAAGAVGDGSPMNR
jgi:hypothetical protein